MKMNSRTLTAEQKFLAALKLYQEENPTGQVSISEICRRAGVNRSSLYVHHRALIDTILVRRRINEKKNNSEVGKQTKRDQTDKNLMLRNRSLLYLCLELRAELDGVYARNVKSTTTRTK